MKHKVIARIAPASVGQDVQLLLLKGGSWFATLRLHAGPDGITKQEQREIMSWIERRVFAHENDPRDALEVTDREFQKRTDRDE